MTFGPRPEFTSRRLRLVPVTAAHAAPMVQLLHDPALYRYLDQEPPTLAYLERQYRLLESGMSPSGTEAWLTWICELQSTRQPIGYVQATIHAAEQPRTCSVGYVVGADYQRQGYAREAVAAMLHVVFRDYAVAQARAEMDTRNHASIALAESLGFRHSSTTTGVSSVRGETIDEHAYTSSADDFVG